MSPFRLPAVLVPVAVLVIAAASLGPPGGTALAAAPGQSSCPTHANLTINCGVVYNPTDGETFDVYEPSHQVDTPLPAVLLIHGGGWSKGSSQGTGLVSIAEQMAAAGLATFSLNYTLDTNGPSYPQALTDVQTAVAFLHSNPSSSGEWDIEPGHIGAVGQSAGAYFAAMLATCTAQGSLCPVPQIQAASVWSAPEDLTALGCQTQQTCPAGSGGATIANYLGCYIATCSNPQTYSNASPVTWVSPGSAPMQIWNSDNELIPVGQVPEMIGEMHADCTSYRYGVLPGNQHTAYTDIVLNSTIDFLQQELGSSPPTLGCDTAPPQTDTASAFDPAEGGASGEVVAFGGCCTSTGGPLADTWTLTNGTWVLKHPATSPPARLGASMAWDPATSQLILFGGETDTPPPHNTMLNDTWTWNGTTWTQLSPATSPPVRSEASLAYDVPTGLLVLFGGEQAPTDFNNGAALNDTWTWNGTNWTAAGTAESPPPARYGASMATDPASGHPILFGGDTVTSTCDGSCLDLLSDTWEWNGSGWQQLSPTQSPEPREFASMAATPTGLVLFGGLNGTTSGTSNNALNTESLLGDTWTFSNGQWTQQDPATSPPDRYGATIAASPVAGEQAVLSGGFTGSDVFDGTVWQWNGTNWSS
jgi:hypothetical protein